MVERVIKSVHIKRYNGKEIDSVDDIVIREDTVAIYIDGEHIISAPCIKYQCDFFVYASLFIELEILPRQVSMIEWKDTTAFVHLVEDVSVQRRKHGREKPLALPQEPTCTAGEILRAVEQFQNSSELFCKTGAVHVAAWANRNGLVEYFEDISRRTAVDKVLGSLLVQSSPPDVPGFLLTSGRVSSDIARRAILLGVPILVSVAPPSDMAIELAGRNNLTLIGFARPPVFNIYTRPERIRFS